VCRLFGRADGGPAEGAPWRSYPPLSIEEIPDARTIAAEESTAYTPHGTPRPTRAQHMAARLLMIGAPPSAKGAILMALLLISKGDSFMNVVVLRIPETASRNDLPQKSGLLGLRLSI
jgi:hypothetical protein